MFEQTSKTPTYHIIGAEISEVETFTRPMPEHTTQTIETTLTILSLSVLRVSDWRQEPNSGDFPSFI